MISISYNPGWSGLSEIPDSIWVITNLYHKSLRCPPFLIHVSGLPRVVSVSRICSNKSTASDEWLRASTGPATESCPATESTTESWACEGGGPFCLGMGDV